jgi:hypothetical protein
MKKYYGKPIINNARILNKDSLNRFIIDKSVYQYFTNYFNGIGNLPRITIESIETEIRKKI